MQKEPQGETSELVAQFTAGNEQAFDRVVTLYQQRLFQSARAILGNETDAMDMVQETFIKAFFHRASFRGDAALYTWLYRILYNLCISSLRRKNILSFLPFDREDEPVEYPADDPGPYEQAERSEIRGKVDEALKQLPPRQRMVFVMKQIDGLKHHEIATIMKITEGAVKASYFHAVKKLRDELAEYGGTYGLS